MKWLCIALLVPVATACTYTMGHEKVEGWPQLQVFEHYVAHAEMRERCSRYVGFGTAPVACAEFRLAEQRCDIWFSADFPPSPDIVQHERLHCAGYDHIDSYTMKDLVARHAGMLARRPGDARSN